MTDDTSSHHHDAPLAARLKADRAAAKLSQRQVANRLETTTGQVSKWEGGHYRPGDRFLLGLAELYDADPLEYVYLRAEQESSGLAGERARRYRAKLRGEASG